MVKEKQNKMENMQPMNSFMVAYLKKGFKDAEQLLGDIQNKESAPIDFHNDPKLTKFIHHFSHPFGVDSGRERRHR